MHQTHSGPIGSDAPELFLKKNIVFYFLYYSLS